MSSPFARSWVAWVCPRISDLSDILGHASVTTTEIYAKANPELTRKYLAEHSASYSASGKYTQQDKDDLIKWLKDNI